MTDSHQERVSERSALIGEELGMDAHEVAMLRLGALLHDIGKGVVPPSLIEKPGRLSGDEMGVVHAHAVIGERIALSLDLHHLAPWIRSHHERFDGTGYPDGLRGGQIPLESRIIFVSDSYDAITSDRPYRKARSSSDAIREVVANSGTQFDPAVVKAFLYVMSETALP